MRVLFLTNTTKYFTTRATHGIMRLSAALKAANFQVSVSDLNIDDIRRDIDAFRPDVMAYSVMSCNYGPVQVINAALKKEFDFLSIFGGPHASYFPEIIENDGVDAVCRGEGEEALVEFLNRYEGGEDYHLTRNFWVNCYDKIFRNPVRPLIKDMDSLPFSDHSLFYDKFWDLRENPLKTFHTSRGCPYNCAYCHIESFKKIYKGLGPIVRMRSVENLLNEILEVKAKYPLEFIRFFSDVFYIKEDWLKEFSEKYPKKIGLPFSCNITPTQVNEQLVELLKKSSCWSVSMGIEAGNEEVRRKILGRPISDEQIHTALRLITQGGIKTITYNILGIPGSSLKDDLKLLDLNMPYNVTYPMATIMTPFPRTRIFEEAVKENLIPKDITYSDSMMRFSSLKIPNRKKVERLQKLLALVVRFQFLHRLLPVLLKLPLDGVYWLLYRGWMGYVFSRKVFPIHPPLRYRLITAKRYIFGFRNKSGKL